MKKIAVLTTVALGMVMGVNAANIAWVSFHPADNTPSANAAAAGFTQAPDVGYTSLLAANGHTVTRFVITEEFNVGVFGWNYALVIISRSVPSSAFQSATETAAWNGLATKVLDMGGYTLRDSRLGFASGNNIPDTAGTITLKPAGLHPIFAGVPLDGGTGNMFNPFANIVTYVVGTNTVTCRGISVNSDPLEGNPTVLATVVTASDPTFGKPMIALWDIGSVVTPSGRTNILGGYRMSFLSGSREASGVSSETAGIFDLTADGAKVFLNTVDYFINVVPEPSSLALLGLGGMALLLRRRV